MLSFSLEIQMTFVLGYIKSFEKKLIQVDCQRLGKESVSNIYNLLDYICNIPTQHRWIPVVFDFL